MSAKNRLNREQIEKLQKALKKEENGDIREKILILLGSSGLAVETV